MNTFRALKELHTYRKRHLSFLRTIEDIELLHEIGHNQTTGNPLQLKTLFLQGIASPATVQRRLARLRRLGVVRQVRSVLDKRVLNLTIDPRVWKLYEHLGKLMRKAWA